MSETIYRVTTEGDCEGRTTTTLGYCTGQVSDIKAYYDDKKYYALRVEPLTVKHISPDEATNKAKLIEEKKKLEERLETIKGLIK